MTPLQSHVTRMLTLLGDAHPSSTAALISNALAEVSTWPEVWVDIVARESAGAGCSVSGAYIRSTNPPTLAVAESASHRRRSFTVLHEYGHHLHRNDAILAAAVRAPAATAVIEEDACDSFASRVIIPEDVMMDVLEGRGPTAGTVRALYETTGASRAACCVRVADALATTGVVSILDPSGVVVFATRRGDIYPPARDHSQIGSPIVDKALATGQDAQHADSRILYRNGSASALMYADAAWVDGLLVVIHVIDRAGWLSYSAARPGTGQFASNFDSHECATCRTMFNYTTVHGPCGEPRCPTGHCGCTSLRDRTCSVCSLVLAPHLFPNGGDVCVDCL